MCYLAQSVEAAGGLLEVLGLDNRQDGVDASGLLRTLLIPKVAAKV